MYTRSYHLFASFLVCGLGGGPAFAAGLDLDAIRAIAPGAPIPMPGELFPPAYRAKLLANKATYQGALSRAEEYLKTPAETWRGRFPARSGIGCILFAGGTDVFNATCPACTRPARWGKPDLYAGTVKMDCCGATFYEDPDRTPAGAPGKPNKTFRIRHLDGTEVEYPYYEFPDRFPRDQSWQPWSPADGSRKHEIFLADGYLRGMRLHELVEKVMPDLGWAYFATGDERYARLLAALFDRLSDLYPGWPLWIPYSGRYGFALNREGNGVLTRAEFDAATRPMRWGTQFWNTFERSYGFGHEKMGALLPQYAMGQVGGLARAYAALRGSEPARAYSREKYGDPDRLDQHVMRDLFGEMVRLYKCYQPWLGNYTQAWLAGAVDLSLLTQDRYCFDMANELMERSLYDECYSDNTPTQGSCSYWGMVFNPLIEAFKVREETYDPDVRRRHPRLTHLPTADAPMLRLASWRWMIPAFGDTWRDLYPTGLRRGARDPQEFASAHFPDYGVSMLRWGHTDGRRQEASLTYQRVTGHNHSDALNLELFVDGLPIFWDMGYGNGTLDTDTVRHPEMAEVVGADWPRPILNTGPYHRDGKGEIPTGHWWSNEWNHRALAHCTVMVDEQEPTTAWCTRVGAGIPVTLMPETDTRPERRLFEVADVEERGAFRPDGPAVSEYRRALLTVQTPGGGGYLVDVFRVAGGSLHEFTYHAISEKASTDLPDGQPVPGTLAHYREATRRQPEKMKEVDDANAFQTTGWSNGYRHVGALRRLEREPDAWRLEWEYDPALYAPRTKAARERVADLLAQQKPVSVAIHGVRRPAGERDAGLWRARGLLTGHLREALKDGTWLDGAMRSNVGFVGGLDMLLLERRGEAGLKSVFVHVLEGRRSDVPAEVVEARSLACEALPEGGVALQVKLAGGFTDLLFCLPAPGEVTGKEFRFAGRYGMVRLDAAGKVVQASLVRASALRCRDFELKAPAPEFAGQAVRFEGDLTGDRSRAAVVVRSERPLPEGKSLAGAPVNVTTPDGWTDVYFVESVAALGGGQWRVLLQGHPTFILDFLTVGQADPKDPHTFFAQEKDLSKGMLHSLYGLNIALVSLRDGRQYPVDLATGENPYEEKILLRDKNVPFAASGLKPGDKAILIRHQPGDKVVIPVRATFP